MQSIYYNPGIFYDWNQIIHNNIPITQEVSTDTGQFQNRDTEGNIGDDTVQIGGKYPIFLGENAKKLKDKQIIDWFGELRHKENSNPTHSIALDTLQLGAGPINWLVNNLPFEMHLRDNERKLKYNYCGPGTKLMKRLARGDEGINELDQACKQHDIAYHYNKTVETRHPADLALAAVAEKIASDPTATKDERDKANFVSAVMRGKLYLGSGFQLGSGPGEAPSSGNADMITKILGAISTLFEYIGRKKNEMASKAKDIKENINNQIKVQKDLSKNRIDAIKNRNQY